jgi:hypothetical protein
MTKNDAPARNHRPNPLFAASVWALAAVVFGVTGWLYGVQPLAIAIGNWKLALDYSDVQAKVVTREGKAPDGTAVSWLAASYEVNGNTYFAERLSVLDDDSLDEAYNSRVLRWLESAQRNNNGSINVHVSPRHPEIALVSNDFPLPSLMSRAPLALGFTLLAIVGALGAVGAISATTEDSPTREAAGRSRLHCVDSSSRSCCTSAPTPTAVNSPSTSWCF